MSRILVVDDNSLNRRLARDILTWRGHEVLEAATVAEGRVSLGRCVPDVVLMDIQISGGGGEALLREMREDPTLARVPVLAVTALAMQGDRERLLGVGFDGYISKPIDTRVFGATIESYVRARS